MHCVKMCVFFLDLNIKGRWKCSVICPISKSRGIDVNCKQDVKRNAIFLVSLLMFFVKFCLVLLMIGS